MKRINSPQILFLMICIVWGIILVIYGESWKAGSIVKNQVRKVETAEEARYREISEKTRHCLTPYAYPGSVWRSLEPEILMEVDQECAKTGEIRVTLNYLGNKHTCFLYILGLYTGTKNYWLEPYIEEWRNRKNGENIFLVLTDTNKMTWYDFHYIVDRSHGINQYKVYDEIPFERIK